MKNRWIQLLIVAVGLYIIWASAKSLLDLRKAGGRLEQAREALNQIKKDNQELKVKLAEVNSEEFVEKEARDKLNLQKSGEVVVVIPATFATVSAEAKTNVRTLTNPEKWWRLFFE